jgi:energy-coupling factor transporter transmembrane protein EcfT
MNFNEILIVIGGILLGIIFLLAVSFVYFFGADKTINRNMVAIIGNPELFKKTFTGKHSKLDEFGLSVNYYLSGSLRLRKVRNVGHYRQDFLDTIFKRHHIAAIVCMLLSFIFLVVVGFFLEFRFFEMPAAASILIFFAVMIAFMGALSYFLQSWSLPVAILLIVLVNFLYQNELIDPRNKAYGLDYTITTDQRPDYNKQSLQDLCNAPQVETDKAAMINVLENWKKKQPTEKPLMIFINVSGGGLRSAAFVMNTLQQLDSSTNGKLMQHTFLISGASGGMLAATYYRELYRNKLRDSSLQLYDSKYSDYISTDLLNPVFTSMIARDIFAPVQKFSVGNNRYIKDRGYAFEKKLSDNTGGLLNIQLKDIQADETAAKVPLIIFNSVIKSDGRKLLISTQPLSFMMKPRLFQNDPTISADAVDFAAMFKKQHPMDLGVLTAMRMNATFPYVLPNVWLPSYPVIDVMDAGLRDNVGTETSLRFIDNFKEWIKKNTSGVVLLQLRDRLTDEWQQDGTSQSLTDMIVTPATMLQHNWFTLQNYYQADQFSYFNSGDTLINKISILYKPAQIEKGAAINFHLSAREKRDIKASFYNDINAAAVKKMQNLLRN